MSQDNATPRRLAAHWVVVSAIAAMLFAAPTADAAFPGRNGRIAFVKGIFPDAGPVIFTMKPNGSDQRKLTGGTSPRYSPNGRQIVFAAHRDGDSEIFTIRANGTRRRQLTHNGVDDVEPAFSPNGRQIVFSRNLGGDEIFKMRSDGTHPRQLTHDSPGRGVVGATFSPNGHQIAYAERDFRPFPHRYAVFHMRPDGNDQRFVALGDNPDYSPYGRHMVADAIDTGSADYNEDIFKVEPNGSGHVGLTSTPEIEDIDPAFSPNGRWIVWSQDRAIFKMRPNGSRVRRLTDPALSDWLPDWQPRPHYPQRSTTASLRQRSEARPEQTGCVRGR